MAKLWLGWIVTLALLLGVASQVGAATLSFAPSSQSVALGSNASVDVLISGLGDSGPPSLGTFDLVVSFDPAILSLASVTFGADLGDFVLGDVDELATPSAGAVNLYSLSFLTPDELDALQSGDSLALATLTFDTLAPGLSALGLSDVLLGDAFGVELALDSSPAGEVEVVPEPAALLLLGIGVAALARRK